MELKKVFKKFLDNDLPLYAAALSFYTVFALGPLFFIVVFVGSLFFDAIKGVLESLLATMFEGSSAELMEFIQAYSMGGEGLVATMVGVVALLFAGVRLFGVLQTALGKIWGEEVRHRMGVALLIILVSGLVVLGVLTLQILAPFSNTFVTHGAGILTVFLLLTFIYKFMPTAPLVWQDAFLTAGITTIFFVIGETLIGWVFGNVNAFSVGNAVIGLLIIIYYNWQVVLLGGQFAREYIEDRERKDFGLYE